MIVSDEPERLKWISKLNIILLFLHIGKEAKGDKYELWEQSQVIQQPSLSFQKAVKDSQ